MVEKGTPTNFASFSLLLFSFDLPSFNCLLLLLLLLIGLREVDNYAYMSLISTVLGKAWWDLGVIKMDKLDIYHSKCENYEE
jgi:hypothetical protein